jgi:alpha-tubulin suppressor-like RCC1 family protein
MKGIVTEENQTELIKKFEFVPQDVYIMNIATTKNNTFLLSTTGEIYSWGGTSKVLGREPKTPAESQKPGLILLPVRIAAIAMGSNHGLALDLQGNVYAWGENNMG